MVLKGWEITSTYVTAKDIQQLIKLAEDGIKRSFTKEEAMAFLTEAGFFDENGKPIPFYDEFEE